MAKKKLLSEEEKAIRMSKLPQWAQDEIHNLNVRLKGAVNRACEIEERLTGAHPDSEVGILDYSMPENFHGLPPDTTIRFFVSDDSDDYVDVKVGQGHRGAPALILMGRFALSIEPSASNVVHVTLKP